MQKIFYSIALIVTFIFNSNAIAGHDDNKKLLEAFHDYGVTKCDKLILKESALKSNWSFYIDTPSSPIHKDIKSASVIQIFGSKNDTVKTQHTYIQTPSHCFLRTNSTTTFSGSCADKIDLNYWYVAGEEAGKDYTVYKNKGGVRRFSKEITVGNFKACIQETTFSIEGKLD